MSVAGAEIVEKKGGAENNNFSSATLSVLLNMFK